MKEKTIKQCLSDISKKFVDSIDDKTLAKNLYNHMLITGGSIASMLLGEKVNDYDIYIDDEQVLKNVCNYYINQFNATGKKPVLIVEDDDEGKNRYKIFIQGTGIVRNDTDTEYGIKAITSNAITLNNDIQIVIRFYGPPEEIHKTFDFIHATNYFIPSKNKLVVNEKALMSLLTKELIYFGSKYPLASIIRTRKFVKRGWTINAGQYLKMALQLNEIDLSNVNALEEQLVGVDVAYFEIIIDAIKKAKEKGKIGETIDNSYLFTIIDRVF